MRGRAAAAAVAVAGLLAAGWAAFEGRVDPVALTSRVISRPLGIHAPDLDDPARASRGARHYAQFCVTCHGSPGQPRRAVARALRPPSPALHLRIEGWPDELLFATVLNGVPNSGMPAWPAPGRVDEVWDMVAFLRRLPDLDPPAYRALTGEDDVAELTGPMRGCVRCHGPDGTGRDGIPRLDIQTRAYLFQTLRAFRRGERASGVMQIAAAGLDDAAADGLARDFAAEGARPAPPDGTAEPPDVVTHGRPDRKIPPCAACHGLFRPVRPDFPSLKGQDRRYLHLQLRLFAEEGQERGGGPFRHLMEIAGHQLGPAEMSDAAGWYGAAD